MTLEVAAKKCSSCHHSRELSTRIIRMQSMVKDYETILSYFLTTRANSDRLLKIKEDAVALGNLLISTTGKMSHSASTSLDEKTAVAMANINYVKIILYATICVSLILSILVAIKLTKSITRPVSALLNATRMITSGKFGSMISYRDKTEFGELAEHFNAMSTAVKEGYDKIQKEIVERRDTEEALRESEEKFRTFFELAPIGIIISPFSRHPLKNSLKYSTMNSAFYFFTGYTKEELNNLTIADITHHEDLHKNMDLTNDLLSGRHSSYALEKRYIKKTGEIVWGYISATVLRSPSGEPSQIMTTVVDITERKKIEMDRFKIEKLESVGILAGGIAHDFNNILTAIVTNLKLAKMAGSSGKDISDILTDAGEACRRAKALTNQLLTFSKGGAPIKKTASISSQLRDSALFALRGSNVKCDFSIPDDLWPVEIDEGQINQVIYNLIINANQAMPDGGLIQISAENIPAGTGSDQLQPDRNYIRATVRDKGPGIPKEHLQKIFDPYYTTKQKGSGLGLASTYSIIANHDGHIDVESEVGAGTTFYIYLPAAKGRPLIPDKHAGTVVKGSGRILLMDDDQNILSTVGRTLKTLGYNVETAADGEAAVTLYKKALTVSDPFDAVILDLTVRGGMGGQEAIEKLLEIDPEARVIVSSGYSTDTIMANYKEHGFCGIMSKPYEIEALSELLNSVISQPDLPQ